MSTYSRTDVSDHHDVCDDTTSVLPVVLATGSALFLGYFLGRVSYARDLRAALRRIEESPEPIDVFIRTL